MSITCVLSFEVPKYLVKKIEKIEKKYDVLVLFDETYGLECSICKFQYEPLRDFIVYNEVEIETASQRKRTFKQYVERYLEEDIRSLPEIQLQQFVERINEDDFQKGDSFFIGDREFEVKQ
jgi:hypothetical protein